MNAIALQAPTHVLAPQKGAKKSLNLPKILPQKRPALGTFILDLLFGLAYVVTHPTAVRNAVGDLVVDLLDVGGTGNLIFRTTGGTPVATLPFSATAFGNAGAVTPGLASANPITADTNAAGGTTDNFTAEDTATAVAFQGSVGTSGEDINLSSVTVGATDTVDVSALDYVAMP